MGNWSVTHTFDGIKAESELIDLDARLEQISGWSAAPHVGQWVTTLDVDARDRLEAVAAAERLLERVGVDVDDAVGVEVYTWDEVERRSERGGLPELVGPAEAAEILGVSRQRIHQLANQPSFPEPLVKVKMGTLWAATAIEAFAQRGRRPGRPAPSHTGDADRSTGGESALAM